MIKTLLVIEGALAALAVATAVLGHFRASSGFWALTAVALVAEREMRRA